MIHKFKVHRKVYQKIHRIELLIHIQEISCRKERRVFTTGIPVLIKKFINQKTTSHTDYKLNQQMSKRLTT